MKRPILISLMITAVISILLIPADMSSGDDIEIELDRDMKYSGITAKFSDRSETKDGVTITVKVYSDVYDLERAGLLFYTQSDHTSDSKVKVLSREYGEKWATYVIADIKESVFMSFINLHPLIPEDTQNDENTAATVVLLISTILAIAMAAMMILIIRGIDSYKASETLQ